MNAELLAGNIAAHWVQSGLLAGALLVALRLLCVRDPRLRLAVLQLGFVAIVLLPMLQPWRSVAAPLPAVAAAVMTETTEVAGVSLPSATFATPRVGRLAPPTVLVATVAAGIAIRLLWVLYGLLQLVRFSRTSPEVPAPAVAGEFETQMGIAPRYVRQTDSRGPWTFGFLRSTVALPARFDALDPGFQRAVICHELHHVKRRDVVVAFAEELASTMLWFHPWVWLLRARIRVTREQVVDASVVALLSNRDEYVRCLVNMSGHDLAPHLSQASAGMLRPRELRARVDAMFQEVQMSRTRFVAAAFVLVAVAGITGWAAVSAMPLRAPQVSSPPVAVMPFGGSSSMTSPSRAAPLVTSHSNPAPTSTASLRQRAESPSNMAPSQNVASGPTAVSGPHRTAAAQVQVAVMAPRRQIKTSYAEYPQDALEKGIGGTVLVDIAVNATGDVTTAAVVSGPQELRASAFKAALGLKYEPGPSTTATRVSVDYTLTKSSWGVRIGDTSTRAGARVVQHENYFSMSTVPAAPDASGAYRVGANIRPPRKIRDVVPEYPATAKVARVQGVVILEARIDENGNVGDARVLRSIPLLDQAASDAVKQWKYEPTLMNGVAVPVVMTMTVNFSLRPQVRLRITLPDGQVTPQFGVTSGSIGIELAASGGRKFGFAPMLDQGSSPDSVRVFIFDVTSAAPDVPPVSLGSVEVTKGGGVVQSATSPSFGIELVSIDAH
jgi:TonB family protein